MQERSCFQALIEEGKMVARTTVQSAVDVPDASSSAMAASIMMLTESWLHAWFSQGGPEKPLRTLLQWDGYVWSEDRWVLAHFKGLQGHPPLPRNIYTYPEEKIPPTTLQALTRPAFFHQTLYESPRKKQIAQKSRFSTPSATGSSSQLRPSAKCYFWQEFKNCKPLSPTTPDSHTLLGGLSNSFSTSRVQHQQMRGCSAISISAIQ